MAVITIAEFSAMPQLEAGNQPPMCDEESYIQSKTYAVSGASAQSDAMDARTKYVWIDVDVATRFEYGTSPTALQDNTGTKAGSRRLPADTIYHTAVNGALGKKFAFIPD